MANEKIKPIEDFDWQAFENAEIYTKEERETYSKQYDETLSQIQEKEILEGTVISITDREVVVNIGHKSEGVISRNEFRYNPDLAVGDKVEIYIERLEDKLGQLIASHKTARVQSAWKKVNELLETGEVVTGFVKCRTKGGLIADVLGIEAFLPGSQIDVKPIRDYDIYVGKNMEFKVVKINNEFKNVVVSHKALIEHEIEEQKKIIVSGLEKGQVIEGIVKNITSYGVFVDLGGIDGLVHITDLSWGRVSHPEEVVELDQKIQVVILDFDNEKKRIALGLKQLQANPWDTLQQDFKEGDVIKGRVIVLFDYGAFIEVAPGVEGLVHVSEMSWSQHLRTANDFLKVGEEIDVKILTMDKEERKMSLGIKQLTPDPWEGIETKFPVGTKLTGTVKNFTGFGVFVELEEGIDGLVHISDLTWGKKIAHPSNFCNVGDELEVIVLELEAKNKRLSLGHKQLQENPWDTYETIFNEGSVHEGTVVSMKDKAGIVSLPYGIEGFCPMKHMKKSDNTSLKVDDKVEFKVIEFNKESNKIVISHTATHQKIEDKKKRKSSGNYETYSKNVDKSTFGDLDLLGELKEKMKKEK